ncbi:MAG: MMPL family transporter [Flavobacteriia bacterium]|nr:MMPL family transporter [Flavobacteriia bacterium]
MKRSERPSKFFLGVADSIWRYPKKWLLGTVLILGSLFAGIPQLDFALDYSRFYTEDSPVTTFFETFQDEFTGDPQAVWLIPETEEHAFHPSTIRELRTITAFVKSISDVDDVLSVADLELPVRDAFGIRTERLVVGDSISSFDSTRIMALPFLRNQLVSEDGRYPAMVIQFDEESPKDSIYKRLLQIDAHVGEMYDEWHFAGRYWGEVQYNQMLQEETIRGIALSVVIIVVVLWLLFKRGGSIILPAIAIIAGVASFFGLKGWAEWPIDLLGVLFPPLLLIVGMSDVVHLYAKIQWKLHLGKNLKESIREAWKETGYATFLTSLTTGIGFMSLLTTKVLPIRNFGWEAAWGVVMMFAVCIVVIPIFLRFAKRDWLIPRSASNETWTKLGQMSYSIARSMWKVPLAAVMLILFATFGVLKVETGVSNYWQIDPSSELKSDLDFFDEHFGGARYLDMGIRRMDGEKVGNGEDFKLIDELTRYLRSLEVMGPVLSASDAPAILHMARYGGVAEFFALEENDSQLEDDLDQWYNVDSAGYHQFVSFDGEWMRISARLKNVKSDSAFRIEDSIIAKLGQLDSEYEIRFTGNSVLMDTTTEMLVGSMFDSLALAFVVIALLMGLLFRSIRMLIISLLPNILPLLVALALIGYLNIPLGTSTALILTIGFVIAVDDTIHYLMKFRLKYIETGDLERSVKESNAQVGRALVLSSAVMLAAFLPQFFSSFLEQFYFAVVTSGVIVAALISDLVLLPWLLLRFFRK